MDTSRLTDSNQEPDITTPVSGQPTKKLPALRIEKRQRLYHRQYRYAIELSWQGFEYLNRLDLQTVTSQFNRRVSYGWNRTYLTLDQVVAVAHWLHDFEQRHSEVKAVNSWHTRFYYTNDVDDIHSLAQCPEIRVVDFREADVCLTDGVLIRKNNPYQYRTYFRERKMSDPAEGIAFLERISAYGDYFGLNPTTRRRLAFGRHRYPFTRSCWVDHNNPGDRVLLEMLLPGFLGRTIAIQDK
jgi:hypothetical protein